jgi:probable phosphoglycerate mutase
MSQLISEIISGGKQKMSLLVPPHGVYQTPLAVHFMDLHERYNDVILEHLAKRIEWKEKQINAPGLEHDAEKKMRLSKKDFQKKKFQKKQIHGRGDDDTTSRDDESPKNKYDLLLFICRHGQTDANTRDEIQSATNGGALTETGRNQAKSMGERIRGELSERGIAMSDVAVYVAPARRTRETAEHAGFVDAVVDDELRDIDWGEFEGMSFDNMLAACKERGIDVYAPIDQTTIETVPAYVRRIKRAVDRIVADARGKCVIIIAHGWTAAALEDDVVPRGISKSSLLGNGDFIMMDI